MISAAREVALGWESCIVVIPVSQTEEQQRKAVSIWERNVPLDDSSEKHISAHGYSHGRCIHVDALLIVDQVIHQF